MIKATSAKKWRAKS